MAQGGFTPKTPLRGDTSTVGSTPQPRRDTAGPSSTALHQPRPGARGAGDGGAERDLGAGVRGVDGASR